MNFALNAASVIHMRGECVQQRRQPTMHLALLAPAPLLIPRHHEPIANNYLAFITILIAC